MFAAIFRALKKEKGLDHILTQTRAQTHAHKHPFECFERLLGFESKLRPPDI